MALKEIKVESCRFTFQGNCVTAGLSFFFTIALSL